MRKIILKETCKSFRALSGFSMLNCFMRLSFALLMMLSFSSNAQVNYTYGWEPTGLGNWVTGGDSDDYARTTISPCNGTASVRSNTYYDLNSILRSPNLGTSTGGLINVQYSYKAVQFDNVNTAAPGAEVQILVQWASAAGGPWTTFQTVNSGNHVVSASCTTKNASFTAPAGSVFIRFVPTAVGEDSDIYYYFDEVSVSEGPAPTCAAPLLITASATAGTTATATWTAPAIAPANGYEYYYSTSSVAPVAGTAPSGTVGAGVTTASLTGLIANTNYNVWVRSVCSATDKSSWTGQAIFFTGYCTPAPEDVDGEGITNVTIGTINNSTGFEAGNYGNFAAQSTNVAAGSTVNFSIQYSTGYEYATKIWVDWNNDLDFTDAGEMVYSGISNDNEPTTLTGSFTVPASATPGNHRLRIGGADDILAAVTPCYTGEYGSFEDYTLNVFTAATPTVTSFTPAGYCAATGVITITGTNLINASLSIGGTTVPVTSATATQIVATVPAGITGTVTVTTAGGTASSATSFSIVLPPTFTLSADTVNVCEGSSSASVTVTAGASAYDTYTWSPSTGVTGTESTGFIFSPAETTVYTVTALNSAEGCVTTTTVTVNVSELPTTLTVTGSGAICAGGDAIALSAVAAITATTILSENFNGATNNWVTTNTSVGGDITEAAWTLRPDNYDYADVILSSNDNTQFYLTNSDAQGFDGDSTTTTLASPAFSTVGYTSANLSFYHFFFDDVDFPSTTGRVEVSLNGTTWTVLQTYTAPAGTETAFANVNISLAPAYLNQPTVYVRFRFNANFGYLWAVDNVTVTGQQSIAVTWSPVTGLYTDATATTPYTGGAATTVYAQPSATIMYTATASTTAGCSLNGNAEVTVTSTPAPVDIVAPAVCNSGTIADLAPGTQGLLWYMDAAGGMPLPADMQLINGATYYASQIINGCESVLRTAVTATVNVTAAPSAESLQQIAITEGEATLNDIAITAEGTVTWYATDEDANNGVNPLADDTVLVNGNTYYATQSIDGCESTSIAVTVTVTLGISDFNTRAFSYYPNPVKDVLNISYSSDISSVAVYNLLGQLVIARQVNAASGTIDMSNLAEGTYMVNVTAGSQVKAIRVIKK